MATVRAHVGRRIAEIRDAGPRLSPLEVHERMEAIRELAAAHGLAALEGLARCSAQLALLPGHRLAVRSCLEHVDDALDSRSKADREAILAALALRLH